MAVRDAAHVHLLADEKGQAGHRYVATGHNLSNKDVLAAIDKAAGRKRRLVKMPVPVARAISTALELQARRTGKPPLLAKDFLEYSLKPSFFSNRKAVEELGATFRPFAETVSDSIAYFRERGML